MFAMNYVTDSLLANTVLVRQFLLFEIGRSYIADILFRKLRMTSEFKRTVSVVLRPSAGRKVFWVDAFRVVAGMKYAKTGWNRTFVYGKRKSVSTPDFIADAHHTIVPLFLSKPGSPRPAFVLRSFLEFFFESVYVFFRKHTNLREFAFQIIPEFMGTFSYGEA